MSIDEDESFELNDDIDMPQTNSGSLYVLIVIKMIEPYMNEIVLSNLVLIKQLHESKVLFLSSTQHNEHASWLAVMVLC